MSACVRACVLACAACTCALTHTCTHAYTVRAACKLYQLYYNMSVSNVLGCRAIVGYITFVCVQGVDRMQAALISDPCGVALVSKDITSIVTGHLFFINN